MKKNFWLLLFFQGLIATLIGLGAILWPLKSLTVLTWFAGAFILLESVLIIIAAFWPTDKKGHTGVMILEGIVGIVAAILVMSYPQMTIQVLFLILAIWAIATGLIGIAKMVHSKHHHKVSEVTLGGSLFKLILGFLLLSYPEASIVLITVLFGAFVLVLGISEIAFSLRFK